MRLSDFFGKPLVMETASLTCPVYAGLVKKMKKLSKQFPSVQFIILYVREAHPGEKRGAHRSLQEKLDRARETRTLYGEDRKILVDELDGTAHKLYGRFPNSVFVINQRGTVAWRAKWNQPDQLSEVLKRMEAGEDLPAESTTEKPGGIKLSAFSTGGLIAVFDFIRALPKLVWLKFLKNK